MNLLIVDDLSSVVQGLKKGIHWSTIGIDRIFTAYNASEARTILQEFPIDIMLCDIEMPKENGLELLHWIRSKEMDLECIFLTAHADFGYMQEAIRSKGFDYILQPAPYDEIRQTVFKAVQNRLKQQRENQVLSYGKVLLEKQENLKSVLLHEFMKGNMDENKVESYRKVIKLPEWDQFCYPVLCQLERESDSLKGFDIDLLQFAAGNIAYELLEGYEQEVLLYFQDKYECYLLVYGLNGYTMDYEGFKRQIRIFINKIQDFLSVKAAAYFMECVVPKGLSQAYEELHNMKAQNVLMETGLFTMEDFQKTSREGYRLDFAQRWLEYLVKGYVDTVKAEMITFLQELAQEEALDAASLHYFYIDFMHIIAECMVKQGKDPYSFLEKNQNLESYHDSVSTLPNMIAFMDGIFDRFEIMENVKENKLPDMVKQYVQNHISQDIKRSDIADYLCVNVDYLARVFKKETGQTIKEWILQEKMKVAKNLICTTQLPMSYIATRVGYDNFSHFSSTYKKYYGLQPSGERKLMEESR